MSFSQVLALFISGFCLCNGAPQPQPQQSYGSERCAYTIWLWARFYRSDNLLFEFRLCSVFSKMQWMRLPLTCPQTVFDLSSIFSRYPSYQRPMYNPYGGGGGGGYGGMYPGGGYPGGGAGGYPGGGFGYGGGLGTSMLGNFVPLFELYYAQYS